MDYQDANYIPTAGTLDREWLAAQPEATLIDRIIAVMPRILGASVEADRSVQVYYRTLDSTLTQEQCDQLQRDIEDL